MIFDSTLIFYVRLTPTILLLTGRGIVRTLASLVVE